MTTRFKSIPLCFALLLLSAARLIHAADAFWTASSGLLPNAAAPPWEFYAEPSNNVTLNQGTLRMETNPAFARASYFQEAKSLSIPTSLVIEATVRFVSGDSTTP